MKVTRRKFLKHTIGTTTACGLARLGAANDAASTTKSITDTHVYIGHWPHRQLISDEPSKLVAELHRTGVSQAWVGSFDGLFHKDIAGVNQRLVDTCARHGEGMLIPFGTINPTLPDWEEDIRRCHETFHMPGIRLHPNYHGYTLDDQRFAQLLPFAATRGLIVQLVVWLEAERHLLLNPHAVQVDVRPLAEKIATLPKLRLVLANAYHTSGDVELRSLLTPKSVYFDFARAEKAADVARLVNNGSSDRVVFGSAMPLHDIDPVIARMQQAQLTNDKQQAIATRNAIRLLAANRTR